MLLEIRPFVCYFSHLSTDVLFFLTFITFLQHCYASLPTLFLNQYPYRTFKYVTFLEFMHCLNVSFHFSALALKYLDPNRFGDDNFHNEQPFSVCPGQSRKKLACVPNCGQHSLLTFLQYAHAFMLSLTQLPILSLQHQPDFLTLTFYAVIAPSLCRGSTIFGLVLFRI